MIDNREIYESDYPRDYGDSYPSILPPQREERETNEIGVIRELSSKKVLEQVKMNMKGFEWSSEKKTYEKVNEPLMNEDGIRKYIVIMHSVITDLITFSNYKEEEVAKLTYYVCEKAIPVIHINWKEFGIKDKSDLDLIDIQIVNLTYGAFKKAVGAGDRGVIGRTISENIMSRTGSGYPGMQTQEKRGGFLSRLNPFSRNG